MSLTGPDRALMDAVARADTAALAAALAARASPDSRDPGSGLTALMMAAGRGDAAFTRALLQAGADVLALDPGGGSSALHKAAQAGSLEVVRLLVEAGAPVNLQSARTGHTPLIEAMWFKSVEVVEYLLSLDTGLNLKTSYGFTIHDHLAYALKVNQSGGDRLLKIKELLDRRIASDDARFAAQALMAAAVAGDVEQARRLVAAGADVNARSPILNDFNDGQIPLHIAAREGHAEIVRLLLDAGSEVNAVDPVFVSVPLHKATYNGHTDITRMLAHHPGVNLDFQGGTNGYTPLLDALWHGFADCAQVLIEAGARTDLRGHDGKAALDLAVEALGPDSPVTALLR